MEKEEDKLQKIIEIEKQLGEIQDVDVLLERILTETRKIVNADAGSIYVTDGQKLKIKYGQNDTQRNLHQAKNFPIHALLFLLMKNQFVVM